MDKEKFLEGLKAVDGGIMRVYANNDLSTVKGANDLPTGIRSVDAYVKSFIEQNGGNVDYVHGEENLFKLVDARQDAVGILFEKLDKQDLFKYVSKNGAFPRKTFSMGEGVEKRYYLEGRRITK